MLSRIWPDDIAECACATMLHYEDFHVEVRVIGSNTHSVLNCLSLWIGCRDVGVGSRDEPSGTRGQLAKMEGSFYLRHVQWAIGRGSVRRYVAL